MAADHMLICNCILLILSVGVLIVSACAIEALRGSDKGLAAGCLCLIFAFTQLVLCACALAGQMIKLAWYIVLGFCCLGCIIGFALVIDCCHTKAAVTEAFLALTGINFIAIAAVIIAVLIVEGGKC